MWKTRMIPLFGAALLCVAFGVPAEAQRGGRGAPAPDDYTGFTQIFDGATLNGWEGDPKWWKVEDGAITGQTTVESPLDRNTFIIWRGGTTKDFELKLEFKMVGGNSGIQYRSTLLSDVGPYVLKGYQADFDAGNRYTGQLYEERGRGFLAMRGASTRIEGPGNVKLLGSVGDPETLAGYVKQEDWNSFHIIARGNMIVHILNSHVMCTSVDDDPEGRALDGLLGLQLHTGQPMKVQFRNIYIKQK